MNSDRPFYKLRICFVAAAWLLTLDWLWVLFGPFDAPAGPHGLRKTVAVLVASGLHFALGVAFLSVSRLEIVRMRFSFVILVAPAIHYLSCQFDEPWGWPILLAPSAAIMIVGILELRDN